MNFSQSSSQAIQRLLSDRKFDDAKILIDQSLENSPSSPDAHYWKGVLHFFQGQLKPSLESLRKTLELDPRHTDAAICLSVLYNDIGRYDDAKSVFEQANRSVAFTELGADREIDRKFSVKHLELADLYFRYRRYDEAIEEYAKAAALDPLELEIRVRLAKAYAKKGYLVRAIEELQVLKRENPRYVAARLQLGLLHFSQDNVLDAELEWEGVLELDPEHREAKAYLEMARSARVRP